MLLTIADPSGATIREKMCTTIDGISLMHNVFAETIF
jgi:hypothetical protein